MTRRMRGWSALISKTRVTHRVAQHHISQLCIHLLRYPPKEQPCFLFTITFGR